MTTSEASTASAVSTFGCWSEMSMPASAMAATATGFTRSPGIEPAERTSTASPARCRSQPAAIWERPALCTQTNSTLGFSDTGTSRWGSGVGGLELGEQGAHAAVDVLADRADLSEGELGGVADLPVHV